MERGNVYRLNACGRDTKDKQWAQLVAEISYQGGHAVTSVQ